MKSRASRVDNLCSGLICSGMVRDIVESVSSGKVKPGDKLLAELELKQQYGISVTAIRKGMDVLVSEGFLTRRRGSGTYVRETAPAPVATQKDAVLLCRGITHPSSHPYYGYLSAAIHSRLGELDLRPREFHGWDADADGGSHAEYHPVDPALLDVVLDSEPGIAGAILHRVDQADVIHRFSQHEIPCVAVGKHENFPFVDYDWNLELARAIALVVDQGARRPWVISSDQERDERAGRIARGMVNDSQDTDIQCCVTPVSNTYSQNVQHAYAAAGKMLREQRGHVDGIVIGSDFHAQGVLDALTEAGIKPADGLPIAACISKESRIHTDLPFSMLVADGHAAGVAVADLLQQHIKNTALAPRQVRLSCTLHANR